MGLSVKLGYMMVNTAAELYYIRKNRMSLNNWQSEDLSGHQCSMKKSDEQDGCCTILMDWHISDASNLVNMHVPLTHTNNDPEIIHINKWVNQENKSKIACDLISYKGTYVTLHRHNIKAN